MYRPFPLHPHPRTHLPPAAIAKIIFGRKSGQLRRVAVKHTDKRVRMMNEILTCIKVRF